MKKTIISTLVLGIALSVTSVFAESNNDDVRIPTTPDVTYVNASSERAEEVRTTSLSRMKSRGMQLIDERIKALEGNKFLITTNSKLTTEQKAALSTILTNNVNGLTVLRGTIASSTDATSTKALVRSIYVDFRIYAVILPQVRLEKRIYDLQNHSVKLSDTFIKTQAKIDEQKAKGKDVTEWQKTLDDAKVLVANDMHTLAGLFTTVSALKPSDYGTTSKMVIESTNASLKSVAKDFNSIGKTLHRPVLRNKIPQPFPLPLATSTTPATTTNR